MALLNSIQPITITMELLISLSSFLLQLHQPHPSHHLPTMDAQLPGVPPNAHVRLQRIEDECRQFVEHEISMLDLAKTKIGKPVPLASKPCTNLLRHVYPPEQANSIPPIKSSSLQKSSKPESMFVAMHPLRKKKSQLPGSDAQH